MNRGYMKMIFFLLYFIFHFIRGLVREIPLPCRQLQSCLCFLCLIGHFYSVPFVKYFYTFLSAHITMYCKPQINVSFCVKGQMLQQKTACFFCGTQYNLVCPLSSTLSSDKYSPNYIHHTCFFRWQTFFFFLQTCFSFQ